MAERYVLDPDERELVKTNRFTLQGKGKLRYPVHTKCVLTNKRFIYHDWGKLAPFQTQMGILLRLLVKGKPVSLPLKGMRIARGKYYRNSKLLELTAPDGTTVMLDRYDKTLDWFRKSLENGGIGLSQTAEEEWHIL